MFVLNEKSGYIHTEDHETSGLEFERADAADLHARSMGKRMQFCKTCFGENRNTLEAQRIAEKEEAFAEGEPIEDGFGLQPERVRPEAPQTSVHASDDAVPAGTTDLLTPPPTQPVNQTGR